MKRWIILFFASLIAAPAWADESAGSAPPGDEGGDTSSTDGSEGAPDSSSAEPPAQAEPSAEPPAQAEPSAEAPPSSEAAAPTTAAEPGEPSVEAPPSSEAAAPTTAAEPGEPQTDAAPAPDPRLEAMRRHVAAFLDLPPPPLIINLPHNFHVRPVANMQALATAFDMDDPENNNPIVHGDPDHKAGMSIDRARFGVVADWNDILEISIQGGWEDRYDALEARPTSYAELVEAAFTFMPSEAFSVQVGLGRVPVGRQAQISGLNLTLHKRAMVSEKLGVSREPGVSFVGTVGPKGSSVLPPTALHYGVSVTNGTDDFTGDLDPAPRLAGRVRLDLFDEWVDAEVDHDPGAFGLSVGGGANYNWGLEAETLTAGVDLGVRIWRFSLLAELMWAQATPTFDTEALPTFLASRQSLGWYAQLVAAIVPQYLEASFRVDAYDDHTALADGGDRLDVTGGVGFYMFSTRLKVHVDYTHRIELTPGYDTANDSLVVQLQAQL